MNKFLTVAAAVGLLVVSVAVVVFINTQKIARVGAAETAESGVLDFSECYKISGDNLIFKYWNCIDNVFDRCVSELAVKTNNNREAAESECLRKVPKDHPDYERIMSFLGVKSNFQKDLNLCLSSKEKSICQKKAQSNCTMSLKAGLRIDLATALKFCSVKNDDLGKWAKDTLCPPTKKEEKKPEPEVIITQAAARNWCKVTIQLLFPSVDPRRVEEVCNYVLKADEYLTVEPVKQAILRASRIVARLKKAAEVCQANSKNCKAAADQCAKYLRNHLDVDPATANSWCFKAIESILEK